MENDIRDVLTKYRHPMLPRPQLSPHKHRKINYGPKNQFAPEEDTITNLDLDGISQVQGKVGSLLYYARAVKNKILVI